MLTLSCTVVLAGFIATVSSLEQPRKREANAKDVRLRVSENVLTLHKSNMRTASSAALHDQLDTDANVPLRSTSSGAGYAAKMSFMDQDLLLLFDTGSSDTWIVDKDFRCVDYTRRQVRQSLCRFGTLFSGSFPDGPIPDTNFNVSYGSGEFVTGEVGLMDVSLGGLEFDQQEVAIVDSAYWSGDNVTSGLIGFAYPALTSSYSGDNPTEDDLNKNLLQYSPLAQTAMTKNLFTSFSLALERDTSDVAGYLALGGLPPVDYKDSFTSTPILQTNLASIGRSGKAFSFYTIAPDGYTLSGGRFNALHMSRWKPFIASKNPVIIDSGTTLSYLPSQLATQINQFFDPPAWFNPIVGLFETVCNATAPNLAVRINGVDFAMSAADLLLQGDLGEDPYTGLCITGIQASRGPYILGDTFLKNVVTVFDLEAKELRFAAR